MRPAVGLCAQIACVWEVTARKPGNVHRFCDFDDATYLDFILSAAAIAPILETACQSRPGRTVLECVRATRQVTGTNTNLGIILLLTPLASVPAGAELRSGVEKILSALDREDARLTYEAIRLANPGGLGGASEQDVNGEPTCTLREAMALAADRDLVARQYANGFEQVFDDVVPSLVDFLSRTGSLESAIISTQLAMMTRYPDTLIARKSGRDSAIEASRRAASVLATGWPESDVSKLAFSAFDVWLRENGHARNPGTTADLLTAGLFAALLQNQLDPSTRFG
jgi:triphosphoribosyl-dephospho-CoA synthase